MRSKRNPEVVITALICLGLMIMVLWVYYGAVFGEKIPKSKKEISVVVYQAGNDGWESLMEGMKQAEKDFSVNINYITMKKDTTVEEQTELVRQEIADGAQGVLLAVADTSMMPQEIQDGGVRVPIVAIESNADAATYTYFSADNKAMGSMLGQEIKNDFVEKTNLKVAVIEEYMERDSVRERAAGLCEVLENDAEMIALKRNSTRVELYSYLENVLRYTDADVIVALNKETLHALCEVSAEAMKGKKVYGIGNTASIVAALEKGKIEKLVFQNEFNIGYLSVAALLKEIDGMPSNMAEIDFYCVGREEVHEIEYERLLYPNVE